MVISLRTAQELEEILGVKYFYRQGIYRLAQDNSISSYEVDGVYFFSSEEVVIKFLQRLIKRVKTRFSWLDTRNLRVKYDESIGKEVEIYGFPKGILIKANTDSETEEDLLKKIENLREEVINMPDIPFGPSDDRPNVPPPPPPGHGPHPGPHFGPEEYHREVLEALRRIEDLLRRIVER